MPTSPLGVIVAETMIAKDIQLQVLAAHLHVSRATLWRFLNGRTGCSRRITLTQLCQALSLQGEEQSAFIRTCAEHVKDASTPCHTSGAQVSSSARGGGSSLPGPGHGIVAESPAHQLGGFVAEHMSAKHLTQSALARKLKVAPSTISRLTRGKLASTHTVDVEKLGRALDLHEGDRLALRTFADQAALFPMVHRAAPAQLCFHELERSLGMTFAEIEDEIIGLRERRNHGEVAEVYRRVSELFLALFSWAIPLTRVAQSHELARTKLQVGFEYCEAQAAHLDWYGRAPAMIQTLTRMEADVLQRFPVKVVAAETTHLLNLRAPLYYKVSIPQGMTHGYRECIAELTTALDTVSPLYHEPTLRIELLRNRAHAYLLWEPGHEHLWKRDLEQAEREAARITTGARETFQALVEYSWAEGYKHLEYRLELPVTKRKAYMRTALSMLAESMPVFQPSLPWQGYALLARIAEAQCLIDVDADEALRRLDCLRTPTQRYYPALLSKIERASMWALGQKQARSYDHRL